MKKYLGYIQVSTEEQVNGFGLQVQRTSIPAYAAAMGYENKLISIEEGESGAKTNRPALQEVLVMIEHGIYTHVVVMKLDRLSRKLKDILVLHPIRSILLVSKNNWTLGLQSENLCLQNIGGSSEFVDYRKYM